MRPRPRVAASFTAALAALALGACVRTGAAPEGPLPGTPEAEAVGRLAAGAAALDQANFSAARTDLGWVYTRCPATDDGRAALLLLATAHLDIRNQNRNPGLAAALAAHVAAIAESAPVQRSLGQSVFLLALEQGAPAPDTAPLEEASAAVRRAATGCSADGPRASITLLEAAASDPGDTERPNPSWLPTLPSASVTDRLGAVEAERDSLFARVAELQEQVRELTGRVAVQQQELERIRRTLRP